MDKTINLLLADDQTLFVQSLRYVIEGSAGDIKVVGVAVDGLEAVRLAEETKPDVVLMDLRMPKMAGHEALPLIRARLPQCRVLILSTFLDEEGLRLSMARGAAGYILKSLPPQDLIEDIRAVSRGASLFSKEAAQLLAGMRQGSDSAGLEGRLGSLSVREREVAALVLKSFSNAEIAERLGLSEQTVRNYVSSVYFKLDVHDRYELLRLSASLAREP